MIGLYNQDSSFFEIKSPDITKSPMTKDVISFTYEESMNSIVSGSLQLQDNDNVYSKNLRVGTKLEISFGYQKPDLNAALLYAKNPTQLLGQSARSGITMYVRNPSGSSSSDGRVVFNCNFYGAEHLESKQYRKHTGITKGALVLQLLTEMGVVTSEINFTRQFELLNLDTEITQRETNYRFLLKYAREWRAIFRISTDALGNLSAIFISPQNIGSPLSSFLMSGAIGGDSIFLEYKEGISNVLEYSWKNHAGESGSGDNVRLITGADGRPTFIRYVTQGDTVKAYELKPERIKSRLEKADNFSDRFAQMKDWLNVEDFEEIKWAFDPIDISTAPQGLGYSMKARILGNPLISAPLKIFFGEGFPVWFTPAVPGIHVVNYYANKVTHTIDRTGYKIDLDIADAFTLTGGSLL